MNSWCMSKVNVRKSSFSVLVAIKKLREANTKSISRKLASIIYRKGFKKRRAIWKPSKRLGETNWKSFMKMILSSGRLACECVLCSAYDKGSSKIFERSIPSTTNNNAATHRQFEICMFNFLVQNKFRYIHKLKKIIIMFLKIFNIPIS